MSGQDYPRLVSGSMVQSGGHYSRNSEDDDDVGLPHTHTKP